MEETGGGDDLVDIPRYRTGAPITFIDGANASVAHGVLLDDEPDLECLEDNDMLEAASLIVGAWKEVRMTMTVHGYSSFKYQKDWLFGPEGEVLTSEDRKMCNLVSAERFLIYYQAIVPRRASTAKPRAPKRRKEDKDKTGGKSKKRKA